MTEAQVKQSYESCMAFLQDSPAEQKALAAKSGYSLEEVMWGCNLQKQEGLQEMEWCNIRYETGHSGC